MLSKLGFLAPRKILTNTFLYFSVPPQIIDSESSPSTVNIRENYNASLTCKASGIPDPEIIWKREDGRKIILKRKKKEGKRGKKQLKVLYA